MVSHRYSGSEISKRGIVKLICFTIPVLMLAGAYIHMVFRYEKIWLFNTIVHENGKYTLLEVIFYFRHFLWELPIKAWYALLLTGLFFYYGQPSPEEKQIDESNIPRHLIVVCGLSVIGIAGLAFIATADKVGYYEALVGLSQYRTSELNPPAFGSHWRNHFLSNIVLVSTSAAFILLFRKNTNGNWVKRKFAKVFLFAAAFFLILTLFFGINMDPFSKPNYLGHQLREIFGSDLSITMLLSLSLLIHLEGKYDLNYHTQNKFNQGNQKKDFYHLIFWSIIAFAVSLFLIIKVLTLDISVEIAKIGQTRSWSKLDLFAWHFFEHSLDYIFTLTLVAFIYLLLLRNEIDKVKLIK